jgi:hypothetical protein
MIQVDEEFYKPYTIGATEFNHDGIQNATRLIITFVRHTRPNRGGVVVICSAERYDHKDQAPHSALLAIRCLLTRLISESCVSYRHI